MANREVTIAGAALTPPATADGTLLFKTGFEGTSQVENHTTSQYDHFTGTDNSVSPALDWLKFKRKQISDYLGGGQLYYEGGSPSIRLASVVTDPTNPSNKVLRFWLKEPNVIRSSDNLLYKSRIQMDIYGAAKGIQDMYQKVRFYMPQSMAALKNYVKPTDPRVTNISWLTIAEFWNNMVHSTFNYEYRLTVGIGKDAGANQPLYFHFQAEDYTKNNGAYVPILVGERHEAKSFAIPFGTWMTIEYFYRDGNWNAVGDKPAGHFYMAVTPDGGKKVVLFNENIPTHNTNDPASDKLTHWNPLKLYTDIHVPNYMKNQGIPMEFYWDDFEIWMDKVPDEVKAVLPQ